ncbi:MAG: deoxyribodipyrimidine photo-lyase, partial [Natronospirillum sp.]
VLSAHPSQVHVVLTPVRRQYEAHGYGPRKLDALDTQLSAFSLALETAGVRVHRQPLEHYRDAATWVFELARTLNSSIVWADREYGLNERRRDAWLGKRLNAAGIDFNLVDDRVTYAPEDLLTAQQQPFKVYTAYKNAWRKHWHADPRPPYPRPNWACELPASEADAQEALQTYAQSDLPQYVEHRNHLTRPVVSGLSPAIANGLLTTRQAFAAVNGTAYGEHPSAEQWLNEWIWREFFYAVGYHFPQVYTHKALQPWTEYVPWHHHPGHLTAWQEGQTGFPIVDAAMRQLKSTGQMPNRARMFTAAFLAKDLLLDWRLGEAWFLTQLNDSDFVVNNGNWQWGASTGVDAAPYFRIFNPLRQAQKFDPEGTYVRQWIPELAHLPLPAIHTPSPMERRSAGYPDAIVIHRDAAERTKSAFKTAKAHHSAIKEEDAPNRHVFAQPAEQGRANPYD